MGCEIVNEAKRIAVAKGLPVSEVVCPLYSCNELNCAFATGRDDSLSGQDATSQAVEVLWQSKREKLGQEQLDKFRGKLKGWAVRNPQAIYNNPSQKSKPTGWF